MEENTINTESISLDEIRELLATKGLDIRELAKEARELKALREKQGALEEAVVKTSTRKGTSAEPVFELALVNYPDVVIRRSTARAEKMMVIMPSQDAYYIKTVKNGKEQREELDRKSYAAFTSRMPDFELPEDFWLNKIVSGTAFFDAMMGIVKNDDVRRAIIGRYFIKRENPRFGQHPGIPYVDYRDVGMYASIPNVLKAFPGRDFAVEWENIKALVDKFGLENTRDLIRERDISLVTDCLCGIRTILEYDFKYESFKQYVLYDSVRMGFADNTWNFIRHWKDTLDMQKDLYGKVKEKYPKHLLEFHEQLAYKMRLHEAEINAKKFEAHAKETVRFEAEHGGYVFIAPKTPQDFYDEATAMNNCLAGYVRRYADGEDHIMFMRDKRDPEKSLVTIELDLNGNLTQAYQACNQRVTDTQRRAIEIWLEKSVRPMVVPAVAA